MYELLSSPLNLTGDFNEDIDTAYEYFQAELNDRRKRPTLFDKEVFIEAHEQVEERPQGFWHIISLEDNHKFTVLPCINDKNIALCSQNCVKSHHSIQIKNGSEKRNICLLRASRLPWIVDIIKLASRNDPSVDVWLKPEKGKQSGKLYLRYRHTSVDYVVIFSAEKHFYRLISAFPVFYDNQKSDFDKDAERYHWSYFDE